MTAIATSVTASPTPSGGYRRHRAPRAALRELLEATLEWRGNTGPARDLIVEGAPYRLTPLTGGPGGVAVLCETRPGAGIPEYPLRRRIRSELAGSAAPNLAIFTDSAHSTLVWSWTERGDAGERVYRELSFRPGEAWGPLRPVLESIAAGPSAGRAERIRTDAKPAAAAALIRSLEARIVANGLHPDGDSRAATAMAQAVQSSIEAEDGPDGVRACWHALLGTRVIDPRCGSGEWLERALRALVPAYEACLQRMDIAVDDLRRRRPTPRRDRLADFKRLTSRAGGSRQPLARRRFATEVALLHNLHGRDGDAGAVRACRQRLTRALGTGGPRISTDLLALNIMVGEATGPGAGRPWGIDDPEPGGGEEEAEIVGRAIATILRMHMQGAVSLAELARALGAADRRLRARDSSAVAFDAPGAAGATSSPRRAGRAGGIRIVRRITPG